MEEYTELREELAEIAVKNMAEDFSLSDDDVYERVEEIVLNRGRDRYISLDDKSKLIKGIFNSIRGYDVLQDLIDDDEITEIMINGPNDIFIEKKGVIYKYDESFSCVEKLEDVIQQIVSKVNRIVNEASPIVDVRLEDGSRVNVVLPPVALNGPIVTIRKFPKHPIDMYKLIKIESVTSDAADLLRKLVQAGYNIFISGGTGSGKTTFLNALSNFIPQDERIITIEDSAELQIRNIPNLVRLEVRNANVEGKNEITIRDLLKSALRMRPRQDYFGRGARCSCL